MKPWFMEVPGAYQNYLRRVCRDPTLSLVWAPDFQRKTYRKHKPYDHMRVHTDSFGVQTNRGCFIVIKWVRRNWVTKDESGKNVHHSTKEPFVVHVFDGEGGEPVVPHPRFIVAMLDTDKCRHGAVRERMNDAARESKIEREKADRDAIAKEQAGNMEFYRALRDFGQEAGMSTPDKDEMLRIEREAFANGARIDKQDKEDIRDSKFLRDRKEEDIF